MENNALHRDPQPHLTDLSVQSLLGAASALVWKSRPDKLCTYFNETWLEFTGRSMEAELGYGWAASIHPEDLQRCVDTYTQSFDRRENFKMEYRLRRHDGEYRWILDIGVPRFNEDRSFAGYIGIGFDITEQKRTEEALRESEELVRMAVQAGKMFAYEWDVATDKLVRSEGIKQILGEDQKTHTTGQQILSMIHPEDRERLNAAIAQLSPEKPYLQIRYRMVRSDSTVIWVDRTSRAYFDEHGKMLRIVGMIANITDRVRAEEALQENQRQLLLVYSNVSDCIFHLAVESDDRYRFLSVNPAFLKATGLAEDQLAGKLVQEVIPEPSLTMVLRKYEEAIRDKKTLRWEETSEYPAGRKVGEVTVTPVFDETGRCADLIGTVRDVTERKRSENQLLFINKAIESAKDAIWISDAQGHYFYQNKALSDLFGFATAEEFDAAGGEPAVTKDPEVAREMFEKIMSGKSWEGELQMVTKSGHAFPAYERADAIKNSAGEVIGLIGIITDLTERKLAEEALKGMSGKLLEAQEQERSRIARELHDDINQRLALLSIEIQRVRNVSPVTYGELRSRMDELGKRTSEISAVVHFLSHELHSSRLEYVGLVSAMKGFCKEFCDKHKVEIDFSNEGIPSGIPPEISQCLFRITQEGLHNALKHSGVKFFEVKLHGSPAEIRLTVRDSGVGFEPELAKGTPGLGLISMRERVRLVKGTISITSKPQSGTEINVRVPLSAGEQTERTKLAGA
jgi:PAS domain S-box-containing protein